MFKYVSLDEMIHLNSLTESMPINLIQYEENVIAVSKVYDLFLFDIDDGLLGLF